jgi:hypothetical protein
MKKPFISLSSDFGVGTQGIGIMRAVALQICPDAAIIDLRHGIPGFGVVEGAWTMESVQFLPIGAHVCVVDPEVGTQRRGIIIKARRGDYLIGPDNGVLLPASKILGGIEKAVEITSEKYMRQPVSPVFHGRDVFAPAAAWLCRGVRIEDFGPAIEPANLVKAPYDEAKVSQGLVEGKIIHVNHFGSVCVNVTQKAFEKSGIGYKDKIMIEVAGREIRTRFLKTFGEVAKGEVVAFPDDYGRIEIAVNMGSFCKKSGAKLLGTVRIKKL